MKKTIDEIIADFRKQRPSYSSALKIVIAFRKKNPTLEKDKLFNISKKMWESGNQEDKMIAIKLLEAYSSYLSFKDMELFENMISSSQSQVLVDEISSNLVAAVLNKNKRAYDYIKKWFDSNNDWLKKASLICKSTSF
ncbi:DNA alkylation repair protein [Candidatus Gottesmanbacteria bacterium]|nr:DNA alkylation repair protein [Candidatus Gottesmanbacteria bacterium]